MSRVEAGIASVQEPKISLVSPRDSGKKENQQSCEPNCIPYCGIKICNPTCGIIIPPPPRPQ